MQIVSISTIYIIRAYMQCQVIAICERSIHINLRRLFCYSILIKDQSHGDGMISVITFAKLKLTNDWWKMAQIS